MKKAPKIDPETIKNGVGNWLLFFVGPMTGKWRLGGWLGEARSLNTGVQLTHTSVFGAAGGWTWEGGKAYS